MLDELKFLLPGRQDLFERGSGLLAQLPDDIYSVYGRNLTANRYLRVDSSLDAQNRPTSLYSIELLQLAREQYFVEYYHYWKLCQLAHYFEMLTGLAMRQEKIARRYKLGLWPIHRCNNWLGDWLKVDNVKPPQTSPNTAALRQATRKVDILDIQ